MKSSDSISLWDIRRIIRNISWANACDYVLIKDIAKYGEWNLSDLVEFLQLKYNQIETKIIRDENNKVLGRAIIKIK